MDCRKVNYRREFKCTKSHALNSLSPQSSFYEYQTKSVTNHISRSTWKNSCFRHMSVSTQQLLDLPSDLLLLHILILVRSDSSFVVLSRGADHRVSVFLWQVVCRLDPQFVFCCVNPPVKTTWTWNVERKRKSV